ncbi:MAG: DUF4168 domain-containing protein [Planktothrix sp. GU0601_MAG3]|nr:MAG: DUF4168 domain-containing protein [Planktothrix sp. GU0601_MAG3]
MFPELFVTNPPVLIPYLGNAPKLAVSYCDQAKRIIESKGLTISQFNNMTRHQQNDPRFRQRIQAEILKLLQSGGN